MEIPSFSSSSDPSLSPSSSWSLLRQTLFSLLVAACVAMQGMRTERGHGLWWRKERMNSKEVTATSSKLTQSSASALDCVSVFERIGTRRSRRNASFALHIKLIEEKAAKNFA
jgi:hypothetical protein